MKKNIKIQSRSQDCSCEICCSACNYRPGYFKFGEAERTAENMGLTLQQFFDDYLVVDWQGGSEEYANTENGENVFLLAPATTQSTTGHEAEANPKGKCIFFEGGKCKIHEKGKPYECGAYYHTMDHKQSMVLHNGAAKTWDNDAARAQIKELLGREPEEAQPDFSDILSMLMDK